MLHIVPGLNEGGNGIAVAAKLIAEEQSKSGGEVEVVETQDFVQSNIRTFEHYSEVWVHSMWLPRTMLACWRVLRNVRMFECSNVRPKLVRMIHGNLDPARLGYHGWKKRLVGPIERWLLRRSDRIVATCEAEKGWIERYLGKEVPRIEVVDLKRFFKIGSRSSFLTSGKDSASPLQVAGTHSPLRLLYLGRRHPLKGVGFLERAVEEIRRMEKGEGRKCGVELRIVSDHFGEELERDWAWCDVLVLPTLSENFGLVVAEALERGKRVITTDGAPAWEGQPGVIYLKGYRDGTDERRVELLKQAIGSL